MDLFGSGAASNNLAPFEHQGLQSRFGEIAGGHKAIMATANDDDVLSCHTRVSANPNKI
jgi:hypothetical protein